MYRWQDPPSSLTVYTDSSWAGCRETRKSTSGATFLHDGHVIKHYSRTQSTIAPSSAEAELYAIVSAASESLGLAAMCGEYGQPLCPYINVDASAAIGIAQRKGLGKARHLDTQSLWIQDAVRERRAHLEKARGTEKPADMFTKHVGGTLKQKMRIKIGPEHTGGRAESAPQLVRGKSSKKDDDVHMDCMDSLEISGEFEADIDNELSTSTRTSTSAGMAACHRPTCSGTSRGTPRLVSRADRHSHHFQVVHQ